MILIPATLGSLGGLAGLIERRSLFAFPACSDCDNRGKPCAHIAPHSLIEKRYEEIR